MDAGLWAGRGVLFYTNVVRRNVCVCVCVSVCVCLSASVSVSVSVSVCVSDPGAAMDAGLWAGRGRGGVLHKCS